MRVGLIGFGAWGRHHADAIAATPGLELAGICAASEATCAAAAEAFPGIPVVADYQRLIALPRLAAVDIVVPTSLHREMAREALRAGRHVLLEKPMALTAEECADLETVAAAAQRTLYVAHEFRLSTQWGRMGELIAAGFIGRPQFATIDLWRRPYRRGSGGWRWDARRVGSWVLEEPIHFFDLACWWLREAGRPVSVYARGARLPSSPEGLWDNLSAVVAFEGGAHASINQSLAVAGHHLTAKVVGDGGAILAFWDGEMDRTTRPRARLEVLSGERLRRIRIEPSGEFFELRAEMARFAQVLRGEAALPITPAEAALAVRISLAAEQSIRTGAPVAL